MEADVWANLLIITAKIMKKNAPKLITVAVLLLCIKYCPTQKEIMGPRHTSKMSVMPEAQPEEPAPPETPEVPPEEQPEETPVAVTLASFKGFWTNNGRKLFNDLEKGIWVLARNNAFNDFEVKDLNGNTATLVYRNGYTERLTVESENVFSIQSNAKTVWHKVK